MRKNKLSFVFAVILFFIASYTFAADFDYTDFKRIPIAHEGRIKPLDRFATLLFDGITQGKYDTDRKPIELLAFALFDPIGASDEPFFFVGNPSLRDRLDLPHDGSHLYSFNQLNHGFIKRVDTVKELSIKEKLSDDEKAFLELYTRTTAFEQTKDALTLVLPFKDKTSTYWNSDPKSLDTSRARLLRAKGENNSLLRLIPVRNGDDWITPWQNALQPVQNDKTFLHDWQTLASAYIHGEAAEWKTASRTLYETALHDTKEDTLKTRLNLEILYETWKPFRIAALLFLFGLIASFYNTRIASFFVMTAILSQVLGLSMRMAILQRPPVSTLYESTLFIAFITACLGWLLYHAKKTRLYLALAASSALLCTLVGYAVSDEQDSLRVLEAVLNTRFWLATHVLVITTGYALSLLTGLMAHLYLALRQPAAAFFTLIHKMAIGSLLFIAGGTLLGGVWADQSWGRFWGWDPKENGALLIALWLIWLLHGKIDRRFTERTYILGTASLCMIVAFSWIGVNLLGVGLHSYGFTSGLASSFIAFCIADAMALTYLWKRRSLS